MLVIDLGNWIESSSNVNENIVNIIVQEEVNLSIIPPKEGKDMTKLFHDKIQVKKTKVVLYSILVHMSSS